MTQPLELGAALAASARPVFSTRRHCCATARCLSREGIIGLLHLYAVRSCMTRPTGRGVLLGSPIAARDDETATLLPNGNVLVAGGEDWNRGLLPGPCLPNCNPLALNSAELYEPNAGTWNSSANLNSARSRHTATLLQNGKALVAGGFSNTNGTLNSAELYDSGARSYVNPIDGAQFFVRQQYLDFLGREPDESGWNFWMN